MDKKRIFIIHGWTGRNDQDWFPWAKSELEKKGFEVFVPLMPNADNPQIDEWLQTLEHLTGDLRPTDIFVGHSYGCTAILRYLLKKNTRIDKVILVAGWEVLSDIALETPEDFDVVKPLQETPIDYDKVKGLANDFVAIFSDNDNLVPLDPNRKIYEEKLGAKIIVERDKGHFMEENGGVTGIPILLDLI